MIVYSTSVLKRVGVLIYFTNVVYPVHELVFVMIMSFSP